MERLSHFFLDYYSSLPWQNVGLEAIAFFFGIASVWYAKKENILVYPVGLIATAITAWLFYSAGYLGDMIVNVYYSVLSLYGWYKWLQKKQDKPLEITRTDIREKFAGAAIFIVTIIVIFAVYKFTDHPIKADNWVDIFLSGLFFTAMWYMALKKIENWSLWIIGDAIAIPLYAYRGLGMLSLQYVFFTILAVQAYIAWRKTLNSSR
ncbi:MAG: nicotinamide riboside transporter PnuC [Flavobacterium sp.]|nr:MAG: nicotinamide riboside transporter PnuC [Flavobacterium sp.]